MVAGDAPFFVDKLGSKNYVSVVVGNSFHVYDTSKLRLVFVGPQNAVRNGCIAVQRKVVFVGSGSEIVGYRSGVEVVRWNVTRGSDVASPEADVMVEALHVFGAHLLSRSSDNVLRVWTVSPVELYAELALDPAVFHISTLLHPPTYLNKILLGSTQGTLRLYNLRTLALVHEFGCIASKSLSGASSSMASMMLGRENEEDEEGGAEVGIMSMAASSVLDVVGVGMSDGSIWVINLRYDEVVLRFDQESSPVTALAFRNDGPAVLVSGGYNGVLTVWSLEDGRVVSSIRDTHTSAVSCLSFLDGEPVMISSGRDNKLVMWVFDEADGSPRMLRSRSGFTLPPHFVRFHGDERHILAAAPDQTLRFLSTINDAQSRELSQGSVAAKAKAAGKAESVFRVPTVRAFASEPLKDRKWDSILSVHDSGLVARTWSFANKRMGKHKLQPPGVHGVTTAVAISVCGSFGVVGNAVGALGKFNMQSGKLRVAFRDPQLRPKRAHEDKITGLAVDALNLVLFSSSLDGTIKVWEFGGVKGGKLVETIEMESPVVHMAIHRDSGFLGVACDDLVLRVLDVGSRKVVRSFDGHFNQITDLRFSPDARWLLSSSMDCTVRVWDIPTGQCLDWARFDLAVTSLDMSPDGTYLATTHVNTRGVFLWANADRFSTPVLKPVDESLSPGDLPVVSVNASMLGVDQDVRGSGLEKAGYLSAVTLKAVAESERAARRMAVARAKAAAKAGLDGASGSAPGSEAAAAAAAAAASKKTGLDPSLVTLSTLPETRWMNLVRMDDVRERNRADETMLSVPEGAPFFIPTVQGLEFGFDMTGIEALKAKTAAENQEIRTSRILRTGGHGGHSATAMMSPLFRLVHSGDFAATWTFISQTPPGRIDVEIRGADDVETLVPLLEFFLWALESNLNFNVIHSLIELTLSVHEQMLGGEGGEAAVGVMADLQRRVEDQWGGLDDLLQFDLCVVKWARGAAQ